MKAKYLIFIVVIIVITAAVLFFGKDSSPTKNKTGMMANPAQKMPSDHIHQSEPLPTIEKVVLSAKTKTGDSLGVMTLAQNEITAIPNSKYSLKVTEFYTHWNWSGRPINLSANEENPAVKIEIIEDNKVLYYQWAFANVPYFNMSGMGGAAPGNEKQYEEILFSLLKYEGVKFQKDNAHKH